MSLALAMKSEPSLLRHALGPLPLALSLLPRSLNIRYLCPAATAGNPTPGAFTCGSMMAFTLLTLFTGSVAGSTVNNKLYSSVGSVAMVPDINLSVAKSVRYIML